MSRNRAALSNSNSVYKVLKTTFLADGKLELWSEWESVLSEMISDGNFDPDTYRNNFLDFLAKKTADKDAKLRFANLKTKDEALFHKTFCEDEKDYSKVSGRKQFGLDIADRKVRLLYDAGKVLMLAQATAEQAALKQGFISAKARVALSGNPKATKFDSKEAHRSAVPSLTVKLNLEVKDFLKIQNAKLQQKNITLQKVQALLRRAQEKLKGNLNVTQLVTTKINVSRYTKKLARLQREVNSLMASVRPDAIAQKFKNQKIGYFSAEKIAEEIAKAQTDSADYQQQIDSLQTILNPQDPRIDKFKQLSIWTAQFEKIIKEASTIVNKQGKTLTGYLPAHWAALDAEINAFKAIAVGELVSNAQANDAREKVASYRKAQQTLAYNAAEWSKESNLTVPLAFEIYDENGRLVKPKDEKASEPYEVATIAIEKNDVTAAAGSLLKDISKSVQTAADLSSEYNARIQQQLKQKNDARAALLKQRQDAEFVRALEAHQPRVSVPVPSSPELSRAFRPIDSSANEFDLVQPPSPPVITPSQSPSGGAGPAGAEDVKVQDYSGPNTPVSGSDLSSPRSRSGSVSSSDMSGSDSPPPNSAVSHSASKMNSRFGSPQIRPNSPKKVIKKTEGGAVNWMASAWKETHWAVKGLTTLFTGGLAGLFFWLPAGICHLTREDNFSKSKPASPTASPTASPRLVIPDGNGVGTAGMNKQMGANSEKLKKGSYDEQMFKSAKEKLRTIVRDQPPKDSRNPRIKLNQGIVRVGGARYKTIKRPQLRNGYELAFSVENGKIYVKKENNVFQLPDVVLHALLQPLKEGAERVAFEFDSTLVTIEGRLAIATVKSASETNGSLAIRDDGQVYQLSVNTKIAPTLIQGIDKDAVITKKLANIAALSTSLHTVSRPIKIQGSKDSKYSTPGRMVGTA